MPVVRPCREQGLAALRDGAPWDVLIIGGGATGLGCAVDAAARGHRTLLVEARDFAGGTSSRSTKLIHGGVRYLRQGDLRLVGHALRERARLLENAAHLVSPLPFVIPAWRTVDRLLYAGGLKLYDFLAGGHNLDASQPLDRAGTLAALPGVRRQGLRGGVRYWDAQFDDARLAIALMRTATDLGATCLNHLPATGLRKTGGRIDGAWLRDNESGESFEVRARAVINATGVWADEVRRFDERNATALLAPSQGIHLVLDADLLPGGHALLVPQADDGRVLFAIPWQDRLLLGTTDSARNDLSAEPQPLAGEIDALLHSAAGVLERAPRREDIRSVFAGLRPLLRPQETSTRRRSSALSREHAVLTSPSGLVTVTGGKWTTYRRMAEAAVTQAVGQAGLHRSPCRTRTLALHGCPPPGSPGERHAYGTDAPLLAMLPGNDRRLHPALHHTEAMVRFALRYEAARTIEDVLARRVRLLFLDAAAAAEAIDRVGEIVAEELAPLPDRLTAMREAAHEAVRRHLPGA